VSTLEPVKCNILVSNFAFKFNLCRYSKVYKLFSHAAEHHISWTLYWITVMLGSLVGLHSLPGGNRLVTWTVPAFIN
jgi:hypothetical protein